MSIRVRNEGQAGEHEVIIKGKVKSPCKEDNRRRNESQRKRVGRHKVSGTYGASVSCSVAAMGVPEATNYHSKGAQKGKGSEKINRWVTLLDDAE